MASRVSRVLALLLGAALPLFAQSGSIEGNARDAEGGPVSGAVVTATAADGSIVRRDISGIDGRYRLGLLPAGTYALEARRLGYRPASQPNVMVEPGRSTEADIVLRRAPTELEPVVVGAAPNEIEREDTRFGTRIEEAELAALPLGYDYTSIIAMTPGARPDQVWGGSTQQANSYVVDGIALNHPGVGGALIPLNPSWLEELEVTGLAAGAEMGNFQGGLIRAVTKSGSNTRTGLLRANGETHRLNSTNVGSTEISSEVSGRREVEAELRGPLVRDRLFYYLSGQLVQRDLRVLNHLGNDNAPTGHFLPTLARHDERKLFGKLTWQASPRDVVDASAGLIDLNAEYFGQTGFETPEAGMRLRAPTAFGTVSWRRSWGARALLDVRVAMLDGDERRDPYGSTNVAGMRTWELGGDRSYHNASFRQRFAPTTRAISVDADVFSSGTSTIRHNWKAGIELSKARYIHHHLRNGGMTWRPSNPDRPTFDPNVPSTWPQNGIIPVSIGGEVRLDADLENGAIYLQDRVDFGPRVSLLLGARHGWWYGSLRPQGERRDHLEAVRDFATEPRIGVIADLTGDNRTVAKAHWGRYHQHLFAQFFDRVEGGGVFTNDEFWYYTGAAPADPRRTFTEAERDSLIDLGRLTLVDEERLNEEGAVFNYRQPHVDQLVIGLERSIGSRWKAEAAYVGRRNRRLVALVDRNLETNYTAIRNLRVTDRFGGRIFDHNGQELVLPVVYLPNDAIVRRIFESTSPGQPPMPNFRPSDVPNLPWNPLYQITTAPGARRAFDQGQLIVTGRFPLWSVTGSLALTRLEGSIFSVTGYDDPSGTGAGPFVRPNEATLGFGRLPNTSELEVKLRVTGALPLGLRGGMFLTAMRGDPFAPTFTLNGLVFNFDINDAEAIAADTARIDHTVFRPVSGQRVFLEPRGSRTYPDRVTLDLHLERGFLLRRAEWVVSLDGFNVLGNRAITEATVAIDSQSDPNATGAFASPRARVAPRTIRVGTGIRF
ncbi:MAG: carboxypeptidase regulatory-like domain-containing protein [Gemmatimonadaceae bacterium]